MSDHYLLQQAQDLVRMTATDAGAPVATGQMGRLHNTPAYAVQGLQNVIFEHLKGPWDEFRWACYDREREDPKSGPVGYGESLDAALVNFWEQYEEEAR